MTLAEKMKKPLALVVLVWTLASCQPPAATRIDPYEGLLAAGRHPPQAAQQLPITGHDRSIALVISTSTEHQFQYIKESVKAVQTSPFLIASADVAEKAAPDYLVQRLLTKLKQRFARVDMVNDFGEALAHHADYIGLIDIGVILPAGFDHSFTYEVNVDLLNPQIERIGSFHGAAHQGYFCMEFACAEKAQSIAIEGALGQFDAAVDAGVR